MGSASDLRQGHVRFASASGQIAATMSGSRQIRDRFLIENCRRVRFASGLRQLRVRIATE